MKNRLDDDSFWDVASLMPRGIHKRPAKKAESAPKPPAPSARQPAPPQEPPVPHHPPVPPQPPVPPKPLASPAPSRAQGGCVPSDGGPKAQALIHKEGTPIPGMANSPLRIYEYENKTIFRVEIYPWPNHYSFFSNFQKNALTVLSMKAVEAPFVHFFSFMPQYHQLTAAQLRFYVYWRKCFFEKNYIQTDLSYLLLFIYEVINLPAKIPPKAGVILLSRLWSAYRRNHPKLDKYLAEWLCDYCLMHGLSSSLIPVELLAVGQKNCSLPEFYKGEEQGAAGILASSSYDYKKSRFYTEENKKAFDTHIPAALSYLERVMAERGDPRFLSPKKSPQKTSRTSFDGAVCVYSEKKRLEIGYLQTTEHTAHGFATDGVKFCENKVRAALGIRSRFSTPALQGDVRTVLERYFEEHLPAPQKKKEEAIPEYEEKYEPSSRGFSKEEVKRIEEASLQVAKRLGEVFEQQEEEQPFPFTQSEAQYAPISTVLTEKNAAADQNNNKTTPHAGDDRLQKEGVRILLEEGNDGFLLYARAQGLLAPTLFEKINEWALDAIGDVAVEETEEGYSVIEDYKEEITAWINS